MKQNHNFFSNLAFNIAESNIGKTNKNPSVGCVIVKNNSVISSGVTSINGRPHAEYNALSKNLNFKDAYMYVTLEPCTHHGITPPCTNLIKKKKIKSQKINPGKTKTWMQHERCQQQHRHSYHGGAMINT